MKIEEEEAIKLRIEIEAEKQRIVQKRTQEKQAALKVIHENEQGKRKRLL